MRFELIDRVMERSDTRLVGLKQVTNAEEYLQDHFPTFPVLPGVMMLETMVQAARLLLEGQDGAGTDLPWVLGEVRALKYGAFVKPGASLRVEVDIAKPPEPGQPIEFKGKALLLEPGADSSAAPVACAGKFSLRRVLARHPATIG